MADPITPMRTDASGCCEAGPWRILFGEARLALKAADLVTPEIDARRIVEAAAGVEPAGFWSLLDEPATLGGVSRLNSMLARRTAGEPLQYVVGSWGFRCLDLLLDRRVLIPRPETELVAGLAIAEAGSRLAATPERPLLAADLGTGSGAIAISLAVECPGLQVFASDVSVDALAVARANLAGAGRAGSRVRLCQGDWFGALPPWLQGELDIVVSNPPYVADDAELPPEVADWEPRVALRAGPSGCDAGFAIIDEVALWLRPGGVMVLELAPQQSDVMARRAEAAGLRLRVEPDLTGRPRALVGVRP